MPKNQIRVCFRLIKGSGDIVAILLDENNGKNMYTCYEHIGQHGDCHKDWVNDCTFPCNEKNFAELKKELEAIYREYTLVTVRLQKL